MCTSTLYMPQNANSVCLPCKGQRVNDFFRIDNIRGKTRWEWLFKAIVCIFQTINTGFFWGQDPLAPMNNTWALIFILTDSWMPESIYVQQTTILNKNPEQRWDSCSFHFWVSQILHLYLLSLCVQWTLLSLPAGCVKPRTPLACPGDPLWVPGLSLPASVVFIEAMIHWGSIWDVTF